jgi:hypothetical protein
MASMCAIRLKRGLAIIEPLLYGLQALLYVTIQHDLQIDAGELLFDMQPSSHSSASACSIALRMPAFATAISYQSCRVSSSKLPLERRRFLSSN